MGFILSGIYFGWGSLKTGFSFGEIRVRRDSFWGDKRRRVLEWRDSFLQSCKVVTRGDANAIHDLAVLKMLRIAVRLEL